MKRTAALPALSRRLTAALAAGCTLWAVHATAGSRTASAAVRALTDAAQAPLAALRWELGDFRGEDTLSPATVLTIGQSPLLLSARGEVAKLWSQETGDADAAEDPADPGTRPVTETPVEDAPGGTDNGVPARTLIPNDPSGYTVVGRTYISNSTEHTLSSAALTEEFDAELTADAPQILILHTHGSESYTPPAGTEIAYSGNHRTTDNRYNVVRVGDEMAQEFAAAGVSVLHDRTLYDYPSYKNAYNRALAAIETYRTEYPSIRFILDVHRDAIEDTQGNEYKVVSAVEGEGTAAQLTLVVGSDGSGMPHPHWQENLKLAVAIQNQALTDYPTLMRPVLLRNSRYNQHATTGSLLVEVGAAGNSPDEAALAGRLFAREMLAVLEGRSK